MCIHRFALARQVKRLIMICIRTKEVDTISLFSNCALRAIFLIGRLVAIWSCLNKILIFCNECRYAYRPQTTSCLDNCATFEMCTKVPKYGKYQIHVCFEVILARQAKESPFLSTNITGLGYFLL